MRRIDIEFSDYRPFPWLAWSLAAASVIWLCVVLLQWHQVRTEIEELTEQNGRLKERIERQRKLKELEAARNEPAAREAAKTREVLNFDWNSVFAPVESVILPDVSLLSMEYDQEVGVIKLQIEVKELESMSRYLAALNDADARWNWRVTQHQAMIVDGQRLHRATISASRATQGK